MNTKEKLLVNANRYSIISFISLTFAVIGAVLSYLNNFKPLFIAIVIIMIVLIAVFIILQIKYNKKGKNILLNKVRHSNVISLVVAVVFLFLGTIIAYNKIDEWNNENVATVEGGVIGTVESVMTYDSYLRVVIKDCTIITSGIDYSTSKISLTIFGKNDKISIGNTMTITGTIMRVSLVYDEFINSYYISNGIEYTMQCSASDIINDNTKGSIFEELREEVREILTSNMNYDEANIAYAVMFGDSQYISDESMENFRLSGLAHLFAVSGLHVGIICGGIYLILKKLEVNAYFRLGVSLISILLMNFVCGFSTSILRSSIMLVCLITSACLGEKYDSLSAIAFSGVINLLISPLSIFYTGFIMSYGVAFSIILLSRQISKIFKFLPRKIASTFGVTMSAQIGVIPAQVYFFNTISPYSLFSNVIVTPLFSLVYVLMIISVALILIIPMLCFILKLTSINLIFINNVGGFISSLPGGEGVYYISFGILILYYIAVAISSSKCLIFIKEKSIVTLTMSILVLTFSFCYMYFPNTAKGDRIKYLSPYYTDSMLVQSDNLTNILVLDEPIKTTYVEMIVKDLKLNRINYLDAVIFLYEDESVIEIVNELDRLFLIDKYYMSNNVLEDSNSKIVKIYKTQSISINDIEVDCLYFDKLIAVKFALNGEKALICSAKTYNELNLVYEYYKEATHIKTNTYAYDLMVYYRPEELVTRNELTYMPYTNYYSMQKYGAMEFVF